MMSTWSQWTVVFLTLTFFYVQATLFSSCTVPSPPLHGSYYSMACEDDYGCRLKQGMKAWDDFDLQYMCHSGYKLLGVPEQRCTRAGWSPPGQTICSDECESLKSSRLDLLCFGFDHSPTECKEKMSAGSYVRFNCKTATYRKVTEPGYDKLVCRNGEWNRPLPEDMCQPDGSLENDQYKCGPLTSPKLDLLCFRSDHTPTKCTEKMPSGTYVRFNCKSGIYRKVFEPGYDKLMCRRGEWDRPLPNDMCQPACGQEIWTFAEMGNGIAVEVSRFPWHAGLYQYKNESRSFEYFCGGSLLSDKLVLTAAHCIRSFSHDRVGVDTSPTALRVAVGKLLRTLSNQGKDKFEQVFEIKAIHVSEEYIGGYGSYASDIAMVELKTPVIYTPAVLPVCLDLGRQNIEATQLAEGSYGKVAGWGPNEKGLPIEELQIVEMPFVPKDVCRRDSTLFNFVTYDKICAGDIQSKVGSPVCNGFGGGGLVFKHPTTNEYYLRGLVSVGNPDCSGEEFTLFTRISKHKDFIEQFIHPHRDASLDGRNDLAACASSPCPIDTLCMPKGEKYRCAAITPGSPLRSHVMIGQVPPKVIWEMLGLKTCQPTTCKHGGTCMDNPSEGFRCFCKPGITGKLCEININNCEGSPCQHGHCYDVENDFECECEPGYTGKSCEIDIDECESNPCNKGEYCINHVNGHACVKPSMSPSCGKALLKQGVPKIRSGQTVKLGAFPWHAGIYEKQAGNFENICGGSLVTTNAILTAAHCLMSEDNNRIPVIRDPRKLRVTLGKLYRDYITHMDPFAQIFTPEKFFIHPDYTGLQSNYGNDIAIIYLEDDVKFSEIVHPVCLDLRNDNEDPIPDKAVGLVPGWGTTENASPSDVLLFAEMPYADKSDCYRKSDLYSYITPDKICAGDPPVKSTVCGGDSGGGYIFADSQTRQFYLRGIVSLGGINCESEDYAYFTDVSKHAELIYKKLFATELS